MAAARLSRPLAFAAVSAIFVTFMAASSVPSPLYVVYQHEWHFSASTLTAVFAVYVFGLLGALLVIGKLSDHLGRRPVLGAAIALEGCALVLFLIAGDVMTLDAARIAQGIATGAAITTLGAALIDLNPPHAPGRAGMVNGVAPIAGLAIGALGCGALVQLAPDPTHLVYVLLLAGMLLAGAAVARMPETSARRSGALASLRPRAAIPAAARRCVRPRPNPGGHLGAWWAIPLARPIRRRGRVRPAQPSCGRAGGDTALWRSGGDRLPAAQMAS